MTSDDMMRPRRMPGDENNEFLDTPQDSAFPGEEAAPVEEFYDEQLGEDGAITEDWQDYDESAPLDDAALDDGAPVRKKSNFNAIVIGIAVLAGLFFLYNAVAGHHGPTRIVSDNLQNAGQLPGTGPAKPSSPFQENAGQPAGGLLNDQAALNGLTGKIDTANNAANGADTAAQTPPPAQPAQTTPAQSTSTLTPMPPADNAAVQPLAPTSPFMKAGTAAAPAAVPAQPAPVAAAPDPRIDQLVARLDADEAKFSQTASQTASRPASATASPDMKPALDKLNGRLDRMEQMQTQLQAQLQSIAQTSVPQTSVAQGSGTQGSGGTSKSLPDMTAQTDDGGMTSPPAKPVHAKAIHHATPAAPAHNAGDVSAAKWVLKSAQPGEAYVTAPNSDTMIAVHVGENFPGLGRVTSIDQTNGQWTVRGTDGTISQ